MDAKNLPATVVQALVRERLGLSAPILTPRTPRKGLCRIRKAKAP